ncbi:MAG: hypothetical protein EU516_00675 [Promethearchaeota archaeon]|nr:MAG: hypothetical protein EU516_00675 [Candidatus Lokiarchaeota archaeon]
MSNRKAPSNERNIKGLVVFREEEAQKEQKQQETVPLEYIDQEDKIKLVYDFKAFGANYLFSLLIANQSLAPISETKVRVRYPDFLILSRSDPPTVSIDSFDIEEGEFQTRIEFEIIEKQSEKQVNLFFNPTRLEDEGTIRAYITFVNNNDFVRALDSEPIMIRFDPIAIERKILPTSEVSKYLNRKGIKKAIKSVGIAIDDPFDDEYYFKMIQQTIQEFNFQLITEQKDKKIAWYFGTDLVSGEDILVIGQIEANKLEWRCASQEPSVLISLLTNIHNEFINRLVINNVITDVNQVINLECRYCGANLPKFPKKGALIECSKCKYEQIVWKK